MEKMVKMFGASGFVKKAFVASLLYMVALLLVFSDVFFSGKSLYPITYAGRSTEYLIDNDEVLENINAGGIYADAGAADWVEIPIMSAAAWDVSNSEMPLWNMYNSMGMPIVDNNNGSTLAPFSFLLYWSNSELTWSIMYILRVFTIMIFTYLFLEELGINFGAAFIGGIVFGFSGYVMLYLNIFFMHVDAFLPMLMWMTLRYAKGRKLSQWVGCSFIVAAMCVGGNPQNLITCCLLAFSFFLFFIFAIYDFDIKIKIKAIALYTCCFLSGIVLTLGYWLSFFTLYANCYSYHGNAGLGIKSLQELVGLILPRGYFTPAVRANWMPYLGMLPFSVILIFTKWRKGNKFRKEKIFFSAFIVLFVLKIVGFPLINWIGRLPILNNLSFTKYNSGIYFAAAVLVAMAINDMENSESKVSQWLQCAFMVLAAAWASAVYHVDIYSDEESFNSYLKIMSIMLVVAVIPLVTCTVASKKNFFVLFMEIILCVEMVSYPLSRRNLLITRGAAFETPPFVAELKELQDNDYDRVFCVDKLLMGNLSALYKICSVGGISATPEIHYWNFMNELILNHNINLQMVTTQSSSYYPASKKYLDMLGAKFFMADDERKIDDSSLIPVYETSRLTIYRNEDAFEKAYTVHSVVQVNNEEEALEIMKKKEFDFSQRAVVEGERLNFRTDMLDSQKDIIEIDEYKANSVMIRCNMATDGLLILNDLYYPGWHVYVNGEKQEILRTNDVMRGVYLQKGNNVVQFIYRPTAFWLGSIVSMAYAVVLVISTIIYQKETGKCKRKL